MRKNKNNETTLPLTISSKDGLVNQITYFNKQVSSKDMSGYYLLKSGEFAYNKSYSVGYDYGSIKRLERYPMGALSTLYICFKLTQFDSDFIKVYFDSLKWYKEIYMIAAEGARNHGLLNVSVEEFFNTKHTLPSNINEQKKISQFLLLLEKRIEKQQRLVESLKSYKRGVTEEFYLKNHRSLKLSCIGEYATICGGYSFKSSSYVDEGKYKIITISNVTGERNANTSIGNYINVLPTDIQDNQILSIDDMVISLTGNVGRVSLINSDNCLLNQRVAKLTVNCRKYKEYIFQVLSSSDFETNMINCGQGAAQKNIKNSDILDYQFLMPINDDLLFNISKVLNFIDDKIIKSNKQLDLLILQKQSFLQQLFI